MNTKKDWLLFLIILFALAVRLVFLNRFPIGITHDELNYIFAAKSLFLTGDFAPGTAPAVLPTGMGHFTTVIAEAPALLLVPFVGPFDFSLFMSRFLGAILSTSIVFAVYLITIELTGNRRYSILASILMAINPWSFLMGRTIFEVNFFISFFLWGFVVLIKNRGWGILRALPLYLLGFFSYTGGQAVFYLFTIITLIYHCCNLRLWKNKKKLLPYLLFFCLMTVTFVFYLLLVFRNQSFGSRSSELYMPNNAEISSQVNDERRLVVPSALANVFINKPTIYLKGFLDKYMNIFSVNNLFLNGEFRAAYSFQKHGTFYFFEFLFMLIGLSTLFSLDKRKFILFITIIAISGITPALSTVEYSYAQRSGFIYPFLIILAAIGLGQITSLRSNFNFKAFLLFIFLVYLISVTNLLYIYFHRFPVYASDGWFFQDRLLSRYIVLAESNFPQTKLIVFTSEPKIIFEEFLFYSNLYNLENAKEINNKMNDKKYEIGNVSFTDKCIDVIDKESIWIFDDEINCTPPKSKIALRITRYRDIHEEYKIYGDGVCQNYRLGSYVSTQSFRDFNVEDQSPLTFCESWITRL